MSAPDVEDLRAGPCVADTGQARGCDHHPGQEVCGRHSQRAGDGAEHDCSDALKHDQAPDHRAGGMSNALGRYDVHECRLRRHDPAHAQADREVSRDKQERVNAQPCRCQQKR
jgi:hypothetical protein